MQLDPKIKEIIQYSILEDLGSGDVTTDSIFTEPVPCSAWIEAGQDLVLAGLEVAAAVFQHVDPDLFMKPFFTDGQEVRKGEKIAEVSGQAASVLKAERVALNFLQHLSGVASLTARFAARVSDLPVKIMDTRKTLPGLRLLEKYAVRMGGGTNHRMGLYDAVLIKDNHIAAARGIRAAVSRVRQRFPEISPIEVETGTLEQVNEALEARADVIMLDNMDLGAMREAVEIIGKRARVEASGNINLDNVRDVALTGVDQISVGALTHSAPAADISLELVLQ